MNTDRETARAVGRQDARGLVQAERRWRTHPDTWKASGGSADRIAFTSWSIPELGKPLEFSVEGSDICGILTYTRTLFSGETWVDGRHIFAGRKPPHTLLVTNAKARRAVLNAPTSVFRLYLPQALLQESCANAIGHAPSTEIVFPDIGWLTDATVERLVQVLASAEHRDETFGRVFLDSISLAIASRLTANQLGLQDGPKGKGALATWRLNRVTDYVEASLDTPIALRDMANAAGLTRMHFAAQFRASTGLGPHKYLLRRRIARAQELLRKPDLSIAGIALDVGFQTQAHFTIVFKKIVGDTPGRWRRQLA
jgi:AraC-like DNA-binding protein